MFGNQSRAVTRTVARDTMNVRVNAVHTRRARCWVTDRLRSPFVVLSGITQVKSARIPSNFKGRRLPLHTLWTLVHEPRIRKIGPDGGLRTAVSVRRPLGGDGKG